MHVCSCFNVSSVDFYCFQDAEDRSVAMAINQALISSVRLETFPKATIDVFITIIETDGMEGCVAAGSTAASIALAHAGIELLGLVVSCSAVRELLDGLLCMSNFPRRP